MGKTHNRTGSLATQARKFDLNIEKILEDWDVHDAVREIIANAIDEEILTKTKKARIFKDAKGLWHVRDFGRGLRYQHLTQKENDEKLQHPNVIGKFGIGLKDALATFHRHDTGVFIRSPHGDISLGKSQKHGFKEVVTLHAYVHPPSRPDLVGTEFVLGCNDSALEKAKDLFLRFSGEQLLERTRYGMVLKKKKETARIYVNGVMVAQEENFLFSYNITSLTKAIRSALNRERSNVGRTAYSDRVKSILLSCEREAVARAIVEDLKGYQEGTQHDELKWKDVAVHACRLLNARADVVFSTPMELATAPDLVDKARADGYEIIPVPQTLQDDIRGLQDPLGRPVRDLQEFQREWNESFQFRFVHERNMTAQERAVFRMTDDILALAGGLPAGINEVKISETMRLDTATYREAAGICEADRIIIKRDQLQSLQSYAGTLLHEAVHARSGAPDVSRMFEEWLTNMLGVLVAICLTAKRAPR
ncbi:MAG: ATP-binding protein [Deltaproteobacteria bacterium]|nr:ATP-binding protein [Deltaproteobacteria bacterium]